MPLPSFLKRFRAAPAQEVVASAATPSEEARTRARRRLIGAAVLVAAGVIGFPLLFDSQPRPLPPDLPIVMPHKDGGREVDVPRVAAAPRVDEPAAAARPITEDDAAAAQAPAATSAAAPANAERVAARAASAPAAAVKPAVAASARATAAIKPDAPAKPASKPASKPDAAKPSNKPSSNDKSDAARAQALLNGQDAAKPAAGSARSASAADVRYIVQIGAFADVPKAHDARLKVEKLGLKTYTQVVTGEEGKRIRVRVGPFPDKDAAEKAAAKIRQAGLAVAILTL